MLDKKNNTWDKVFTAKKNKYGRRMQPKLLRVARAIEKGHILDIGIGEGRNSLFFAEKGSKVLGLDLSQVALDRVAETAKENNLNIDLKLENILDSQLEKGKYQLIIASWVLNFFKKSEVDIIMTKIKDALADDGVLYFGAFGTNDPHYKQLQAEEKEIEEKTFFLEDLNSHAFFFDRAYLESHFKEFQTISISSEEYLELNDKQRYRGIVEYIGRKKKE